MTTPMPLDRRRVVVTGMGAVTPLAVGVLPTWEGLLAGHNGIGRIRSFDPEPYASQMAGEVLDFDPVDFIDRKQANRTARFTQFALAATMEAMDQSRLTVDDSNRFQVGVIVGSGIGGLKVTEEASYTLRDRGPRRLSPFTVPMILADIAAGEIAMKLQACGPNFALISACATGAHAIGEAAEIIRRGDAVACIAGASEASVTPLAVGAFAAMRALSQRNEDPEHASRPFDKGRDGFVVAESCGIVVLEDLDHARRRGARILAEVAGYGATADAHHLTAPDPSGRGARHAMARALEKAGAGPEDVDYINAHGTSTELNDAAETSAIKQTLGDQRARQIPISSTKSMTGHSLGGAGAIESIFSVMAIVDGRVPPTINYEDPDPECDLDYVTEGARRVDPELVLNNSFGFGGHNACLAFRRLVD
ncbi:MAG TPA: beta-ketoacyl-ACP synthase II [Candidatus Dormibacteraeota bacterium]|nr:beta-ketoacyl-ACP synthase II [Candidatus Dormibacteraeota bacterium]